MRLAAAVLDGGRGELRRPAEMAAIGDGAEGCSSPRCHSTDVLHSGVVCGWTLPCQWFGQLDDSNWSRRDSARTGVWIGCQGRARPAGGRASSGEEASMLTPAHHDRAIRVPRRHPSALSPALLGGAVIRPSFYTFALPVCLRRCAFALPVCLRRCAFAGVPSP